MYVIFLLVLLQYDKFMYRRTSSDYQRRLTLSAITSCVIHGVVMILFSFCAIHGPVSGAILSKKAEPLVLHLSRPESPKRLVENVLPAERPVDATTELIAEQDSNAADTEESPGDVRVPHTPQKAEFEETGAMGFSNSPSPPRRAPLAEETPPEQKVPQSPKSPAPEKKQVASLKVPMSEPSLESEPDTEQKQPPNTPLQNQPKESQSGRVARARVEGGAKETGILSFEAHRHAMAPYLQKVRQKVENRWKAILQTRYSGTASTQAVLDCAIGPDGNLVYVRVVDPGDSPTYAYLCKEAIEQSGPFGKFPVEVPAFFRSQNIEIRWTFSFFM